MSYKKDVAELAKLLKTTNKLAAKILNENTIDNPREKFQLMVTSDNVASLLGRLINTFADKL